MLSPSDRLMAAFRRACTTALAALGYVPASQAAADARLAFARGRACGVSDTAGDFEHRIHRLVMEQAAEIAAERDGYAAQLKQAQRRLAGLARDHGAPGVPFSRTGLVVEHAA